MKSTEAERAKVRKVLAERRYWKRYEQIFGWTLYSWTYKLTATFRRSDGSSVFVGGFGGMLTSELDELLDRAPKSSRSKRVNPLGRKFKP